MGRPSDYGPEIAGEICDRLASGQTLREICRDEMMPKHTTIYRWMREHDEFRSQYAQAREAQADTWADEIVEIADDGTNDWMERRGKDGEALDPVADHEHISRSKLRVEARKWLMGKAAPKKYGDKVDVNLGGEVKHGADDALARIFGRLDAAAALKSSGGLAASGVDRESEA
ncbi:terminase small subunit protein [Methylobacterium sp. NMS14P]|uniref:terminase small subunit-like protein n=1 Tax=Methylobacterium sp. NMS14P TaxID=2894310 RepID=UPI0023593936|nr:terminase small subunit protein [Methylobacterium sp. NMS14P]WCS27251.1 terminase small subunit protein [Methylobacterium sp. NMS14P]